MAARALRLNLFRTALTLLGIVIGVASVVAMLSLGAGARQRVVEQITAMGPDLLVIRPGARNVRTLWGSVPPLTEADRLALLTLPSIRDAISEYPLNATVRAAGNDVVTQVNATTPNFPAVRNWPLLAGTFFTGEEDARFAAVAVLGTTVAAALFGPGVLPLGEWVLINNIPFEVQGVLAPREATPSGMDQDDVVLIPLATGRLRIHGQNFVRSITAQIADTTRMEETQAEVEALLQARRGAMDFQVRNTAAILAAATASQDTMTLLLGSIALISLLVGGIGVMNIMLVSVTDHARDRGAHGRRRPPARHPAAVQRRGVGGVRGGRDRRHRGGDRGCPRPCCLRSCGADHAGTGAACLRLRLRHRHRLRPSAGAQGGGAGSGRRARRGMKRHLGWAAALLLAVVPPPPHRRGRRLRQTPPSPTPCRRRWRNGRRPNGGAPSAAKNWMPDRRGARQQP